MDLLTELKQKAAQERHITLEVLQLLARAKKEQLFAERGYDTMFDFCVRELRYSEGAASRRIGAMRLLKQEEIHDKLLSGEMNITTASKLEGVFRREEVPMEERKELIASVEGLSTRAVEKKLSEKFPDLEVPKKELRSLGEKDNLLKIVIDNELLQDLETLKARYSHRKPGMSFRDLVEFLAKDALSNLTQRFSGAGESVRYISAKLKRIVWKRDKGRCTFVDPLTNRECGSIQFLQFDHIIPVAHGGRATEQNLRLLCRTHNLLMAEKAGLKRGPNTS